jgi:hypothetical protein
MTNDIGYSLKGEREVNNYGKHLVEELSFHYEPIAV